MNPNSNIPQDWAMLASEFHTCDVIYPMLAQPKLNGIRAKWCNDTKRFISRQCEVWNEGILSSLTQSFAKLSLRGHLDGELYCHGMPLQDINSRIAIKRLEPHEDEDKISFMVFDYIMPIIDARNRQYMLQNDVPTVVPFRDVSADEVTTLTEQYKSLGYEGTMLRNPAAGYKVGRTYDLLKLKAWQHMEVMVVGMIEGIGKLVGKLGAFVVQDANGNTFNVGGGKVTEEQRRAIWLNPNSIMGKKLKIHYRDFSNDNVPMHPQISHLAI